MEENPSNMLRDKSLYHCIYFHGSKDTMQILGSKVTLRTEVCSSHFAQQVPLKIALVSSTELFNSNKYYRTVK